jgi:glutamine synthetase
VIIASGLKGVEEGYRLEDQESDQRLPANLDEALSAMEKSELVREVLGEHVFEFVLRNKRAEWQEYRREVTAFELDRYLPVL